MRRSLYTIAALALLTVVSCNKEDDDIPKAPDTGYVRFVNASASDHYEYYLDDFKMGSLYGDDTAVYPNITTGAHTVKAQQIDVVGGTLRQQQIIIFKDTVTTFVFP